MSALPRPENATGTMEFAPPEPSEVRPNGQTLKGNRGGVLESPPDGLDKCASDAELVANVLFHGAEESTLRGTRFRKVGDDVHLVVSQTVADAIRKQLSSHR